MVINIAREVKVYAVAVKYLYDIILVKNRISLFLIENFVKLMG
jgi:hypothetical protein